MSAQPVTFWRCDCGHPLYEHGRRVVPNAGIKEYVGCRIRDCICDGYRASDGSAWPPDQPARDVPRRESSRVLLKDSDA